MSAAYSTYWTWPRWAALYSVFSIFAFTNDEPVCSLFLLFLFFLLPIPNRGNECKTR
jgi:hypothetical protein